MGSKKRLLTQGVNILHAQGPDPLETKRELLPLGEKLNDDCSKENIPGLTS